MPDLNELIATTAAAEAGMLVNGPDDGRREALERAKSELWWAHISERYAGWTGREGLLAQWGADA